MLLKLFKREMILCITIEILVVILKSYNLQAFQIVIKPNHPRLFITKNFQKNFKYIRFNKAYKVLNSFCNDHMNDNNFKIVNNKNNSLKFIRAYAFFYLITKKRIYLKKIKKLNHALILTGLPIDDQFVRNKLEAASLIYDWCYYGLSIQEKNKLISFIENAIKWLEKKGYLTNRGVIGGHHYHAHKSALMGAIAIYYESKYAQNIFKIIIDNLKNHYWPFYKFLSEEDGGFHMWWEYSKYYHFVTCQLFDILRSATGEDLFHSNEWLNKTIFFLIYGIKDTYQVFMTGDNHCPKLNHIDRLLFLKIAKEYKNGYAKWWAKQLKYKLGYYRPMCVFDILWDASSVKAIPPTNLPTSKLFKRVGIVSMREGWTMSKISPCVSAIFKCTPYYFENHTHRDANSFEIYYRGNLAIDSGYYDRYGSSHWLNYYTRTIAHNTIVVYDPYEVFKFHKRVVANDGGQKIINPPKSLNDILSGHYNIGGIIKYEDNKLYTYSIGDASNAYSKSKIKVFKRHFLFVKHNKYFKHPLIIIFDHIKKTKPIFKTRYLLHSVNRPLINGNIVLLQNKKAVLYNYIMYPKSPIIEIIGGPGHEFEVNGKNYPPIVAPPHYAGRWRIEISAKSYKVPTEYFLNVLVIDDKNCSPNYPISSLSVKKLSSGLGCVVGNQVFFFSVSESNKLIEYNIKKNKLLHHFVFNCLPKKSYKILFNFKTINYKLTEKGTLIFDTTGPGKVKIY